MYIYIQEPPVVDNAVPATGAVTVSFSGAALLKQKKILLGAYEGMQLYSIGKVLCGRCRMMHKEYSPCMGSKYLIRIFFRNLDVEFSQSEDINFMSF